MKNLSQHISESFMNEDAKDDMRINDIVKKAAGNQSKADQLASTMAKAITDKAKALRRYEAALSILGKDNSITLIFAQRAQALGNHVDINAPVAEKPLKVLPGSQRPHSEQYHTSRQPSYYRNDPGMPILPCGSLNFKSGENKYFNVKQNGESTLEVWKDMNGKIRIVATSGKTPIWQIGTRGDFCHDQTRRPLFSGVMIDYIEQEHMDELIPLYGKSALQYVYK